ncbi:MAG: hypothetical protein CVT49_14620 [candidate division Zixibacteria bacterium HGW-Zixibacteria-1]|nr:MAG: hypothetical protein CVT49_14620 [candidate division Zixibacteria bacterium HGW-Zixibacteria-1]
MMIYWDIFKMAVGALWANRLRSGLTLLGVIIGVTSVITIISAIEGFMGSVQSEIDKLGPTTFIVDRMGMIMSEDAFLEAIKRKPLEIEYADAIVDGCKDCEKIALQAYSFASEIKYRDKKLRNVYIRGTSSTIIDIVEQEVDQGRFFSSEEDHDGRHVVFVGTTIQKQLFPNSDPIGKRIKIGNIKYDIIGIAKEQGATFGHDADKVVFIPFNTFVKDFGTPRRNLHIYVKARSMDVLENAMDQTRVVLRAYRHVPYDKDDDFSMLTAESIMNQFKEITKFMRVGLVGITSISLVVGGIIIMNIMMVSVTERTREIGIRKSIGARQKDILFQFLYESVILSMGGGVIGIALGMLLGSVLVGLINMDMSPSMLSIILGLSISSGIGLFFGIYPAMKAARMQPVKALSYE